MLATILPLLAAEGAEGGNPLLKLNPGLSLWTLIIFLGLLLILWKFGWGMMISKLDARDRAIRGAIDQAKQDRQDAERLLAEQKSLLDQARRDAAQMITTAREEAGRERQKLLEQAREEYEGTVARGREQIEQETRAALGSVRQAVADLAVDVAGKLIQKNLDGQAQRQLAEKFVQELERPS